MKGAFFTKIHILDGILTNCIIQKHMQIIVMARNAIAIIP